MYAIFALILMFTWFVGLATNMIGSYAYVFLLGAACAWFAHLLGKEEQASINH